MDSDNDGKNAVISFRGKNTDITGQDSIMGSASVPSWMMRQENYMAPKDSDHFIGKSIMKLLGLLTVIRESPVSSLHGTGAVMRLIFTLMSIVLMAISHNMAFTYLVLAFFLLRVIFIPANHMARVLKEALGAAVFSMLLLLPSVFMGVPRTMLTVSLKVFVSVGLISLLSALVPFNRIISALKVFHLPDMFILILDITLKYIAILGEMCLNVLASLRLRSVGKNRKKGESMSGVLGVTFLKSREMADEMYAAMICRGFEGEYHRMQRKAFSKNDIPLILFSALLLISYIYLETVI